MANASIPGLPVAITLDGTEQLELVQPAGVGGTTKRATAQQIANLAPSNLAIPVTVPNGGTGNTSATANGVLLGNGVSAFSVVSPGTSSYVLTSNGTGSAPSWQAGGGLSNQPPVSVLGVAGNATASPAAIAGTANQVLRLDPSGTALAFGQVNLSSTAAITGSLASSSLSGIISVPNGGTGTSALTGSSLLLGNGVAAISVVANATSGYVLTANGTAAAPTFQASTSLSSVAGPSALGVSGTASAIPGAITGTTNQVLRVGADGTTLAFGQINLSSTSAITGSLATSYLSGIVGVPNGGTGTSTLTANTVLVGNGTNSVSVVSGSAEQVLKTAANGTTIQFGQVNLGTSAAVTSLLPVSFGGTGASTLTSNGVVLGNGTAAVNISTAGSAGQIFVGQTTLPSFQTMTGDLTLNSAGSAVVAANAVTFAKFQTMVALSVHGNSSSATTNSVAIAGTVNQVLRVDPSGTALAFGQINLSSTSAITGSLASSSVNGIISVANGGSGTSALTANGLVAGNGTSAVTIVTAGSAGQLLIGQTTTSNPAFSTIVGDLTFTAAGTSTIANNAVTYAKFQTMVALSVHANSSSATTNSTAVAGVANQVLVINSGGTALVFGAVNLASNGTAITGSLTSANIATSAFMMLATTGQAFSGGVTLTSLSLGTAAATTTTLVAGNPPLQRIIINGTATFVAPSSECEIDILVTNAASASTISFSGYSVGSNTGDTYATTNASKFILMSRTINGSSTYSWKALQ